MKRLTLPLLLALAVASAILPFPARAQEAASTTEAVQEPAQTPAPAPIEKSTVNVTVRYQGTVVYSGAVSVDKASTRQVSDSSGTARQIPSDSALSALIEADAASPAFSISNLSYYADFGSFYMKCVFVADAAKNACDNWQYVVNGSYPARGSDSYVLSSGDSVYFYFGNPRRVTLSSKSAEKGSTVTVRAESYDYQNDAWTPLSGATVGATQPNPADPYSPLVVTSVTTGGDGAATLSLDALGTYGIGLAMDYYGFGDTLDIIAPQSSPSSAPATQGSVSGSAGGSSSARRNAELAAVAVAATASSTAASTSTSAVTASANMDGGERMVFLGMTVDEFIERYKRSLHWPTPTVARANATGPAAVADNQDIAWADPLKSRERPAVAEATTTSGQTASAADAADPVVPTLKRWWGGFMRLFTK